MRYWPKKCLKVTTMELNGAKDCKYHESAQNCAPGAPAVGSHPLRSRQIEERSMTRRKLFEVIARALATASAAIVGIPAIRYLIDPLRRRPSAERGFQRLVRVDALAPGVPREVPVRDLRQDAWTLYPEETIGRVWIVRESDESVTAGETRLHVFTTQCPHLGCAVQLNTDGKRFECPCHKAGFMLSGARMG